MWERRINSGSANAIVQGHLHPLQIRVIIHLCSRIYPRDIWVKRHTQAKCTGPSIIKHHKVMKIYGLTDHPHAVMATDKQAGKVYVYNRVKRRALCPNEWVLIVLGKQCPLVISDPEQAIFSGQKIIPPTRRGPRTVIIHSVIQLKENREGKPPISVRGAETISLFHT